MVALLVFKRVKCHWLPAAEETPVLSFIKCTQFYNLLHYSSQTLCLSVSLSVCLPIFLSFCLSVSLSLCLSVCLSVCQPACLPACLPVCLLLTCACQTVWDQRLISQDHVEPAASALLDGCFGWKCTLYNESILVLMLTHTHTCIHAHTHAYTHTHMHAYTHAHTNIFSSQRSCTYIYSKCDSWGYLIWNVLIRGVK